MESTAMDYQVIIDTLKLLGSILCNVPPQLNGAQAQAKVNGKVYGFTIYGREIYCTLRFRENNKLWYYAGYSRCNPNDIFDPVIGAKLAARRALEASGWWISDLEKKMLYHDFRAYIRENPLKWVKP